MVGISTAKSSPFIVASDVRAWPLAWPLLALYLYLHTTGHSRGLSYGVLYCKTYNFLAYRRLACFFTDPSGFFPDWLLPHGRILPPSFISASAGRDFARQW